MSYLYANSAPANATQPGANAYSRFGSTTPAMPQHSPYVGSVQPQTAAYPHSSYPGAPGSGFTPSVAGSNVGHVASPLPGQIYLPSGGQLTVGTTVATSPVPATPASATQPFMSNVQPGSMTYTTTTDALGRVTYHHFRAEPATYRSPQGVTYTGIQWVPTETSSIPPTGIAPAGPEVLASFRGQLPTVASGQVTMPTPAHQGLNLDYRDDGRDWEKDERRRKKEEKRRNSAWEAERAARERAEDRELRKARERDADLDRASRMRRPSHGGGLNAAYDRERSRVRGGDPLRERELRDREEHELERRMGDLDVNDRGEYYGEYGAPGTRSRRQSMSARVTPGAGVYDDPAFDRDADDYGRYPKRDPSRRRSGIYAQPEDAYGASERGRPASIYGAPASARSRPSSVYASDRSPYRRPTDVGFGGDTYPPGHILAGQPVRDSGYAQSRNPSPNFRPSAYSGGLNATSPRVGSALSPRAGAGVFPGASPRVGGGMPLVGSGGYGAQQDILPAPEAFSRPINRAQTFTPFNDLRVQDMDELLDDVIHPMPPVLSTHDVLPEDWGRLMHDLMLAWKGRLPLPLEQPTKRSDLIKDIIELWNSMFFLSRLVELVLYKGRNCKSGPGANLPETRLLPEQLAGSDLSDDESEDESEEEFGDPYGPVPTTPGGRRLTPAQRREMTRQAHKKKRLEEKVQREMELNKRYTLWLKYVEREY